MKKTCANCNNTKVEDFGGLLYYCTAGMRPRPLFDYPEDACYNWKKKRKNEYDLMIEKILKKGSMKGGLK